MDNGNENKRQQVYLKVKQMCQQFIMYNNSLLLYVLVTEYHDDKVRDEQNDFVDDIVYSTTLLKEVDEIEKETIKLKVSAFVNVDINF